jgi:hypothetical protein
MAIRSWIGRNPREALCPRSRRVTLSFVTANTRKTSALMVAMSCLLTLSCTHETQERPLRSGTDEAPRPAVTPSPALFPSTAFTSPNDDGPPARFATRRIGAGDAPERRGYRGATIDLDLKSADLQNVFRLLSDVGHVNIVVDGNVSGTVTLKLRHVPWDQALDVIVRTKALDIERDGNVILVRTADPKRAP